MRKMEIREVDNQCYIIRTEDFYNDQIEYHWDLTTNKFYAQNNRTYKRVIFEWKDFSTFGSAVEHIWKLEAQGRNAEWRVPLD